MRALSSASVVTVAAAALLLPAPAAFADGDNGTVKIHDAVSGEEYDRRNMPHVCSFYLDAFGFDGRQQVSWRVVEMPPTGTKGTVAEVGDLTLDMEGHGRSADISLVDGHYKLVWNFDGEHGRAKHKVFWVDCDGDRQQVGGSPSPSSTASATPEPAGSSDEVPVEGSASPDASTAPAGEESAAPPRGDLAETGAGVPAGALAAAAASMLGAGAYLVLRRRNMRSGRN